MLGSIAWAGTSRLRNSTKRISNAERNWKMFSDGQIQIMLHIDCLEFVKLKCCVCDSGVLYDACLVDILIYG